MSRILTKSQLAREFNVHPDTITNWEKKNIIKAHIKINNRSRYCLEDVMESISANKQNKESDPSHVEIKVAYDR